MNKYEFYWKFSERPKRIIKDFFDKVMRRDVKSIIQKEVDKHRNEIAIDSCRRLVKLLGWTDQYDDDYYYVIQTTDNHVELLSCVCGFTWLKPYLPGYAYYNIIEDCHRNSYFTNDINITSLVSSEAKIHVNIK